MKPANTKALIKEDPALYRNCRTGSRSSMQFGFAVGNGWFDVLFELTVKIGERARSLGILPGDDRYPAADQVKEKFGGLRFYMTCHDHEVYADLLRAAEKRASRTCEHCGRQGKMTNSDGWYCVRCERCLARKSEIFAEQTAAWDRVERAGGYRAAIDEAFAEVDAAASAKDVDK